jgi:hypothetical protein
MIIAAEQEEIKHPEGATKRFTWTKADDPPLEIEGVGKRWMKVAPMASDGRFIYAIVPYHEDGADSARKATYVEVYELKENVIHFVSETPLLNKDGKNWVPKTKNEEGGYFDHGHLACNGKQLVWSSLKNFHIFDVKSGDKLIK